MKVREFKAEDTDYIRSVLVNVRVFKPQEIQCALEIIELCLSNPQQSDYRLRCIADEGNKPLGYVCYGKTPLTDGVYDLYWIAVDPLCHNRGIGGLLLKYVENDISQEKARMLVAETSSLKVYEHTRLFYQHHNFLQLASIPDFYEMGDDKIIFVKKLNNGQTLPG